VKELVKGILSAERDNAVIRDYPVIAGEEGNDFLIIKKLVKDGVAYVEFAPENPKRSKKPIHAAAFERSGKIFVVYPVSGMTFPWQAKYLINCLEKPLPKVVSTYISPAVASLEWLGEQPVETKIGPTEETEPKAETVTEIEATATSLFSITNQGEGPLDDQPIKIIKHELKKDHPVESAVSELFEEEIRNPLEDEPMIRKYLKGWTKERVEQLLKVRRTNAKLFSKHAVMIPSPNDMQWVWYEGSEYLEDGFIAYLVGKSLALESPPGCGKEVYLNTMAFLLYQPITFIRCHGGTTEAQLEGSPSLTVEEGQTVTGFDEGLAITRLRQGYIVVLDEVNAINPAYTFVFHDVANGSKVITSAAAHKEIRIHSKAWLCITLNKGTRGSYEMNEAFVDRMSWINLRRPDNLISVIKSEVKGINTVDLTFIDDLYQKLLKAIEAKELAPSVISVRGMIEVASRLEKGQSRLKAVTIGLVNKLRIVNKRQADILMPIVERECTGVQEAERYAV